MHLNSDLLFKKYFKEYFKSQIKVLEIGPSGYPSHYCKIIGDKTIIWHTLDISSNHIAGGETNPFHVVSENEYHYPFNNDEFDIVLSGQVMEHVKKIWDWLDELKRITKKGGLIMIINPISWTYHAVPVDCWRIYPEGMKALMDDKGLEILECHFESLEKELIPKSTPTLAGDETLRLDKPPSKRIKTTFLINRFLNKIPKIKHLKIPVTVSYDNVCICRKP